MIAILKRMEFSEKAMREAQEAANQETKGSAGDKHETARAMMQLERDKHAGMLHEAIHQKKILESINTLSEHHIIQSGSLVITNEGRFYISIGLGKIQLDDYHFYALAPTSPVGELLLRKKKGDRIEFRNITYIIEEVF